MRNVQHSATRLFKSVLIGITLVVLLVFVINSQGVHHIVRPLPITTFTANTSWNYLKVSNTGIIGDGACQVPDLNPYDSRITPYLSYYKPPRCHHYQLDLVKTFPQRKVSLNYKTLNENNLTEKDIKCVYQEVYRNNNSDTAVSFKETQRFNGSVTLNSDVVQVKCWNMSAGSKLLYENILSLIGSYPNRTVRRGNEKPNVVMLGYDSMSRLNCSRFLYETNKFLRDKLKANVYNLHVKCGLNTRPNVAAMMTGKRSYTYKTKDKEIPPELSHCTPSSCLNGYIDDWPMIWKDFQDEGYTIAFGEDTVPISAFNYRMKGFKSSPTYHYLRPFWLAWDVLKRKGSLAKKVKGGCVMHEPKYEILLKWMRNVLKNYESNPLFGFFMSTYTHDSLNQFQVLDQPVLATLKAIYQERLLENTILIFFGDHGLRFGKYRKTWMGRLEDNMPYLSITLPLWMKTKYPHLQQALAHNQNRLTTWFDIHATLRDIKEQNFDFNGEYHNETGRGLSLFKKILANRTCQDAGIPLAFCPCLHEKEIDVNDDEVRKAAVEVIDTINKLLSKSSAPCARLKFWKVVEALSFKMQDDRPTQGKLLKVGLRVVVEAAPSGGLFETVLTYSEFDKRYIVRDSIVRVNKYKGQDHCIRDSQLERYCYCQK